jgi:hypothetical protein
MKHLVLALCLSFGALAAAPAEAGSVIEKACLRSDRPAAGRALCGCLQKVADAVLSSSQQKRGATFFADPHKSQEVKASQHPSDDAFWDRWEVFAATAVKHCQ